MIRSGRSVTLAERRQQRSVVSDPAIVTDAAAAFLAVRPRSVAEVRRRLRRAGYEHDLVEQVIGQLISLDYLDDEAFARAWVESRDRSRPRGAIALRRELSLKGVARDVIDGVLEARSSEAETGALPEEPRASVDLTAAWRLMERRRAALMRELDPRKRRAKAYALLARNGFDPQICRNVAATMA